MEFTTPKGTVLQLQNIKGKWYLNAAARIVWFREEHPDWCIQTTPVTLNEKLAIFRCDITNGSHSLVAQAHKHETPQGFSDYIEKAETGAIARAIALCGLGTLNAMDIDEGTERLADSPQPNKSFQTYAPKKEIAYVNGDPGEYVILIGKKDGDCFNKKIKTVEINQLSALLDWAYEKFGDNLNNAPVHVKEYAVNAEAFLLQLEKDSIKNLGEIPS